MRGGEKKALREIKINQVREKKGETNKNIQILQEMTNEYFDWKWSDNEGCAFL